MALDPTRPLFNLGPNGSSNPPSNSNNQTPGNRQAEQRPQRPWWRSFWWLLALAILVWNIVVFVGQRSSNTVVSLPYSEFLNQVNANNVSQVNFQGTAITGKLKHAITYPTTPPAQGQPANPTSDNFSSRLPDFGDPSLLPALEAHDVQINVNPQSGPSVWVMLIQYLLPWVLFIGIFWLLSRRAGQAQQNIFSFGRSRAKVYNNPDQRISFKDVAGVDEAKADLQDIIQFLREPARFQRLGGRVPKGILLVGPPGTGKTLLAKATAGEANVPFFIISGPEFVEVLVGVGASRVRDLFQQAKKQGPSIIFIDEIDAVGRRRGAGAYVGSNEEREQTLNQILVEMDGFDENHVVVVLAATNRADVLDPALLRPGRFDRQVTVDRPDRGGREAILKVHVSRIPLAQDVDLGAIARATPGMVGADLANVVNEAALLGARRSLPAVDQQCFWDALEKIQLGAERPLVLTEDDRRIVAYHEAGHTLVALLSPNADPVNRVTIVPRGHALGVTLQLPTDDRYNYSRAYLLTRIAVAMGGRVAEEIAFGDVTTGAENDLALATDIIRHMVTRWGMSERVGVLVAGDHQQEGPLGPFAERSSSEFLGKQLDSAMQDIATERMAFTRKLLSQHKDKLDTLAQLLLENESVDAQMIKSKLNLEPQQVPSRSAEVEQAAASASALPAEH